MSYILEALKKSQAERQLGHAPTIHAVQIDAPVHAPARGPGPRWWAALALAAGAGAATLLWMQRERPAPSPIVAAAAPRPAPAEAPVAALPPPPVHSAPIPKAAPRPALKPAPLPSVAPSDDNVRAQIELPEATQRELPLVSFGGYMYSNNPADRLVLVDKVLRHEGEQVAPGLVLEKLLPKGAIMNYKGTRYRVQF